MQPVVDAFIAYNPTGSARRARPILDTKSIDLSYV